MVLQARRRRGPSSGVSDLEITSLRAIHLTGAERSCDARAARPVVGRAPAPRFRREGPYLGSLGAPVRRGLHGSAPLSWIARTSFIYRVDRTVGEARRWRQVDRSMTGSPRAFWRGALAARRSGQLNVDEHVEQRPLCPGDDQTNWCIACARCWHAVAHCTKAIGCWYRYRVSCTKQSSCGLTSRRVKRLTCDCTMGHRCAWRHLSFVRRRAHGGAGGGRKTTWAGSR